MNDDKRPEDKDILAAPLLRAFASVFEGLGIHPDDAFALARLVMSTHDADGVVYMMCRLARDHEHAAGVVRRFAAANAESVEDVYIMTDDDPLRWMSDYDTPYYMLIKAFCRVMGEVGFEVYPDNVEYDEDGWGALKRGARAWYDDDDHGDHFGRVTRSTYLAILRVAECLESDGEAYALALAKELLPGRAPIE